jgi:hypothetical protein
VITSDGAASVRIAVARDDGVAGSIGTYDAPTRTTASAATTISIERSSRIATGRRSSPSTAASAVTRSSSSR